MRGYLVGALVLVLIAGLMVLERSGWAVSANEGTNLTARATLQDGQGRTIGQARLKEGPHGVVIQLELENAPPGTRALHLHEVGRCEAPDFESAGDHFAPGGSEHGFLHEEGPHAGDLPNVHIPESGRLSIEIFASGVTLTAGPRSLLDGDGAALVLHEGADDYESDPGGEAGDRAACGVVQR
jgi:superoxide dismutase, Cu-Zn family